MGLLPHPLLRLAKKRRNRHKTTVSVMGLEREIYEKETKFSSGFDDSTVNRYDNLLRCFSI